MSVTIGTIAGSTGLGSERQVVRTSSGDLWAFQYTGTNVLSTWVSQDSGATWSTGATHTLSNNHNSEGRNLAVGYKNIGGVDVVHIALPWSVPTSLAVNAIRATISGTTITFHSVETAVSTGTADGGALLWVGSGVEFDSNNKVHLSNGFAAGGNGDVNSSDSTADAGTAEQMTPVTWASHVIDSSVANETRSAYVVDLGGGSAGLIADNGSGHANTTGIDWYVWNGSSWNVDNTNHKVTGTTITAINKNDWGAVAVSASDVHAVYRNASGNLIHRRYNGTSWVAGQTIPAQNSLANGGIALTSDGASVWLCIIDTDSANTVRSIRWSSITSNGIQDAWDASWQAVETSTATRTFIGCTRDTYNQNGLVYWTEGSSFVSASFPTPIPIDPAGSWIQSAQGSSAVSATTFGVTFVTQNVVAGNRIIAAVTIWHSPATTVTSVTDSAGNAYLKDKDAVESDGTHTSIWSAPITVGGGTKPTVTAHASSATAEWALFVHEVSLGGFDNRTSGYISGTNAFTTATASSPITSGAASPVSTATGEFAFGTYGDGGNNITTIGVSSGWTQRGTSIQATGSTAEGACASQPSTAGVGSNASFTLSSGGSPAGVLVVVYSLAASPGPAVARTFPRVLRASPYVLRRELPYLSGQRLAYPVALTGSSLPLASDLTSSSASSSAQATSSLAIALSGTVNAVGGASSTLTSAVALSATAGIVSTESATLSVATSLSGVAVAPSTVVGSVTAAVALSGTARATSTEVATLGAAVAVVGQAQVASVDAATLSAAVVVAGQVQATSADVASLTAQVALAGQVADSSAAVATGTVTVALAGQSQAVSSESATLSAAVVLAGTSASSTTVNGNVQALTGTQLAGTFASSMALKATLTVAVALAAPVSVGSAVTGTSSLAVSLSGSASAVSMAVAAVGFGLSLSGGTAVLLTVVGTPQSVSGTPLFGVVGAVSRVSGGLTVAVALVGGFAVSVQASSQMGVGVGLVGLVTAVSSAVGVLGGAAPLQLIQVKLNTRSMVSLLITRNMVLIVFTRGMGGVARTRDMAASIVTRSESSLFNTRG